LRPEGFPWSNKKASISWIDGRNWKMLLPIIFPTMKNQFINLDFTSF
jgi:hypothetical protein